MNKQELVNHISASTGLSKKDVDAVLEFQAHHVQQELAHGSEATLPGIGRLTVKERAARIGRNPATGEELKIKAKKVPHFSAAKALKDAVA